MKPKYFLRAILMILVYSCGPNVEVLQEVPIEYIGVYYESSEEVENREKVADSIVIRSKFFGYFVNPLEDEESRNDVLFESREYQNIIDSANRMIADIRSKSSEILGDMKSTKVKEVRVKNDSELNIFCIPSNSSINREVIIQLQKEANHFYFYEVWLDEYDQPEFELLGRFIKK